MTIPEAVRKLVAIVEQLRAKHKNRRFTLDGRLVGDLGEILAAQVYDIKLNEKMTKHHDAKARDGRSVQIKATMQDAVTFPVDHTPEYVLAIKVHNDGAVTEIFNGPGRIARQAVAERKPPKTNLHSIPIAKLSKLNATVPASERIPRR